MKIFKLVEFIIIILLFLCVICNFYIKNIPYMILSSVFLFMNILVVVKSEILEKIEDVKKEVEKEKRG